MDDTHPPTAAVTRAKVLEASVEIMGNGCIPCSARKGQSLVSPEPCSIKADQAIPAQMVQCLGQEGC